MDNSKAIVPGPSRLAPEYESYRNISDSLSISFDSRLPIQFEPARLGLKETATAVLWKNDRKNKLDMPHAFLMTLMVFLDRGNVLGS
jgi:hypothetical protein